MMYTEGRFIGRGGWIETPDQRFGVHHIAPIVKVEDLAQVPIRTGKTKSSVGDVVDLVRDISTRRGRRDHDGPASCSSLRSCPGPTPST